MVVGKVFKKLNLYKDENEINCIPKNMDYHLSIDHAVSLPVW
jgi:hypothetical protein